LPHLIQGIRIGKAVEELGENIALWHSPLAGKNSQNFDIMGGLAG
jgi:hypothetical protein